MEPNEGSSQPTAPDAPDARRRPRLTRRTLLITAAVATVILASGTAVAATRLRGEPAGTAPVAARVTTSTTATRPATAAAPAATRVASTAKPKHRPKHKPKPRPTPKLRRGDHNHSVLLVQRRLIELGYADLAAATGRFDEATQHAVLAFQKVHGLGRDGVVGKETWKALRGTTVVPKARVRDKGFHIETDLTRQVTYLVEDGRVTRIINASTASGGTYTVDGDVRRAVTPTGSFTIERKINGWRRSKLGLLYKPAYFVGGYAYHGSYSVPGWPASHGCVRMAIATMDRLYDEFAVGTRVHIYRT